MNPNRSRIVLRPRGPFDTLDLAFILLRNGFIENASFFLFYAAISAMFSLSQWYLIPDSGYLSLFFATIPFFLGPFIWPFFTWIFAHQIFSETLDSKKIQSDLFMFFPRFMVFSSIYSVCELLSLLSVFVFVPFQISASFFNEVFVLERTSITRSFRRTASLALSQGGNSILAAFSRLFFTLWAGICFEFLILATFEILQIPNIFGSFLSYKLTPFFVFGSLALQPFISLYRLLLYIDTRTHTEGWDLQVALKSLGEAP